MYRLVGNIPRAIADFEKANEIFRLNHVGASENVIQIRISLLLAICYIDNVEFEVARELLTSALQV